MQIKELSKWLDKVVLVRDGDIKYPVKIVDIKLAYGSVLWLVEPVGGCGQKWVKDWVLKGY
jgi:hypothetical protein